MGAALTVARITGVDLVNPIEQVVAANVGTNSDPTVPGEAAQHAGTGELHTVIGVTDNPIGGSGGVHVLTSFAAGADAPAKFGENWWQNSHYTISTALGRMAAVGTLADFIATATKSGVSFTYLNWLASTTALKPASEGGTIAMATFGLGTSSSGGSVSASVASGAGIYIAIVFVDQVGGAVTPPDSTWTQIRHASWPGIGEVYSFWKPHGAETGTNAYAFAYGTTAPPSVTTQPTVTGSLTGSAAGGRVGEVLSVNVGAAAGSPAPTPTPQWTKDGVDIPGANTVNYPASGTLSQSDAAGHSFDCYVTWSNGISPTATSNRSNAKAIPAPPALSGGGPVITHQDGSGGPYRTLDFIAWSDGAWTGAETFTYQVYRNSAVITGATSEPYQLQQTDEGASIRVGVTAHGPGGPSTEVLSAAIVPQITAQLSDASFLVRYSGGAGNADASLSVGGPVGATIPVGTDPTVNTNRIVGPIPGSVARNGGKFYAGIYFTNTSPLYTAAGGVAFIEQQFQTAGLAVRFAVPQQAAGVDLPALPDRFTAPSNVVFSSATDALNGEAYGDLPPNSRRGLWLEFDVAPGTPSVPDGDYFSVVVEASSA